MRAPGMGTRTWTASIVCGLLLLTAAATAQDPWADQIVSYEPGSGAEPGYTEPAVTLGQPERYTGEGAWPGAVTPFNPPWLPDEIVSLGAGGHLIVGFDEPITNDATHLFGVDFTIFGNGSFFDADWPNGEVGGLFEEGPFTVSVSADGTDFIPLDDTCYDALFPTLGYLDLSGPYDPNPGAVPSNFTKPVDPTLTYDDFAGASFADIVAMYDGSGGGIPFDISATNLSEVYYVRIDVFAGATSPEFDAFAAVPEPTTALLLGGLLLACALRRG